MSTVVRVNSAAPARVVTNAAATPKVVRVGASSGSGDAVAAAAAAVAAHVADATPHPVYDEIPTLRLIFENGLI